MLFSEMNVFFKREMKSRKSMAYEKKEALKHLKSGENYISKNLRGVKVDNGNNEVLVKNSEYFDVMNVRWLYNIQHIIQHVRVRLPYCGIYMLHNGSKITPKEFIEKYVIPNAYYIDNEMDYDTFLRKHVKSTEETEYLLDLERINSEFQRKRDKLDNFDKSLDRHFSLFKTKKGKHEMKDKYFREELEIMQGIIDLVHSDGKNNYLLENIRGQINYDPSCEDFCYFVFSSSEKRLMKKIIDVSYALTHDKLLNPEQINYYYKLKGTINQTFELSASDFHFQVLWTSCIRCDKWEANCCLKCGGKFNLSLFCRFLKTLCCLLVFREVDAVGLFEFGNKVVDDHLVDVVTTKVCVAVGCQNFEYTIANFQNGNVERTTTKVVDKNFLVFVFALVKTVSKRCSGWLVDDTKNFQSGNFACVLCCLTLSTCSDFPVCRSCSYADTTSESYMPDNSPATILFTASFPVSKRTDPSVHSPPTTAAASTTIPANIFRLLTLR